MDCYFYSFRYACDVSYDTVDKDWAAWNDRYQQEGADNLKRPTPGSVACLGRTCWYCVPYADKAVWLPEVSSTKVLLRQQRTA